MEESTGAGDLEMRIVELENQLRELRAAQESAGGGSGAGAQVAAPCNYCGYCYCDYCYAAGGEQAAAQPCAACRPCASQAAMPCSQCSAQAAMPCSQCSAQAAQFSFPPIFICRICFCIVECICGPCMICLGGGGFGGGGGRFGGLGG